LTPEKLEKYLIEKMKYLGTAACPPYHIAFVIGGTSADACMKTVKLATARDLDGTAHRGQCPRPGLP
jgi:fumarate hydratase, class I